MQLIDYRKLRAGVQINAEPGPASELASTEAELRRGLVATGLFEDVEVEHTEDVNRLVVAMCTFTADLDEDVVAQRLEDIWNGRLSFGYWEAHSVLLSRNQVELQGATLSSLGGHYVTVHVLARKLTVPTQRAAGD